MNKNELRTRRVAWEIIKRATYRDRRLSDVTAEIFRIEGNNIDDAKRELKYLDMLNIDRLLNKLVSSFEHSEQSCYGDYTNYSPCDKKCGKSYKYKTYRIKRPAGILGKRM